MPRYRHQAPVARVRQPDTSAFDPVLLVMLLEEFNAIRQACGLPARTLDELAGAYARRREEARMPQGEPA